MNNEVNLVFDEKLKCLAGYDYGISVFDNQIENTIDLNNEYKLKFPDAIEDVSSSFAQGMFSKIIKMIGLENVIKRTHIISIHKNLSNDFMASLV